MLARLGLGAAGALLTAGVCGFGVLLFPVAMPMTARTRTAPPRVLAMLRRRCLFFFAASGAGVGALGVWVVLPSL